VEMLHNWTQCDEFGTSASDAKEFFNCAEQKNN